MRITTILWIAAFGSAYPTSQPHCGAQEAVDLVVEQPPGEALHRIVVEKKWGFINRNGEIVIEPQFDWVREFSDGMCQASKGGKWGYIDQTGRWAFDAPLTHDDRPFRCGVAVVYTDKGQGIVNRTGSVIDCPFDWIHDFSEGLTAVFIRPEVKKRQPPQFGPTLEQWGFVNTKGEVVVPTKFTSARAFSGGLAAVYVGGVNDSCTGLRDGKWGFMDQTGKFVIEPQFLFADSFSEGLATVSLDGKNYGWIDSRGKFVIQPRPFTIATSFHEGVARIRGTPEGDPGWKEFGYITKEGTVFVHPVYSAMSAPFCGGLAEARAHPVWDPMKESWVQGNYGYVDKQGCWVIDPQFSHSGPFQGGLACVQRDGMMMYIDKSGKTVWPKNR